MADDRYYPTPPATQQPALPESTVLGMLARLTDLLRDVEGLTESAHNLVVGPVPPEDAARASSSVNLVREIEGIAARAYRIRDLLHATCSALA